MDLSVIVPVYNAEKYLPDCLRGLANMSTRYEVEFILVNDGSNDNSLSICYQFRNKDIRFIIIDKENGGVSSARNTGLRRAKGKYIYFVDSDDIATNNLEKALDISLRNNIDFMILRRFYITRNCIEYKYVLNNNVFVQEDEDLYRVLDTDYLLGKKFFLSGSGEVLFKASLANDIEFNTKISLLEDIDFFMSLLHLKYPTIYFYNRIVTRINDEVLNSLTKKKEYISTSRLSNVYEHPYLKEKKYIKNKILWFEVYFHLKKLVFFDRWRFIISNSCKLTRNLSFCKYTMGCLGLLLLNVDINRIRIYFNTFLNNQINGHQSISGISQRS